MITHEQDITGWMIDKREQAYENMAIVRANRANRQEKHTGLLGRILELERSRKVVDQGMGLQLL